MRQRSTKRIQKVFTKPSMAKQAFKNECDINVIMAKYAKTGLVEHQNRFKGDYGDFLDIQDYQVSLNQVIAAKEMFEALPAKVRARFENDPGYFVEFASNPTNLDELVNLGLATKKEPVNSVSEEKKVTPTKAGS